MDSDQAPDVGSTQMPDIRVEPPPDETGRAASSSILATIPSPLPTTPPASEKPSPCRVGRAGHNRPFAESIGPSRSASAKPKPLDLYREIKALKKRQNKKAADFFPEHSLRDLFRNLYPDLRGLETLSGTDRIDELATFICERAPKAFATLVFAGKEDLIISLFDNGLDDDLLPVVRNMEEELYSFPAEAKVELADMALMLANEEVSRIRDVDPKTNKVDHKARKMKEDAHAQAARASDYAAEVRADAIVAADKVADTFEHWPERTVDEFCDTYQWRFLAPVFDGNHFYNMFAEKAVMPFWPSGERVRNGPFSSVEKWQVHRAHLPPDVNQVLPDGGGGHPWVAVKVLKRDQFGNLDDFKEAVRLEAKVLNVMSSLKHHHLIRTIACYRKGPSECFLFPWADYGNLRDFWDRSHLAVEPKKRLAPEYLRWVFLQLHGLAEAITKLHSRIIRHGDLKPENILCFRNSAKDQPDGTCSLVIADAGLAKVNYQITQLRTKASLGPKGGTLMYEPPEAEVGSGAPVSRRYDVWSMGCIYLEFLIWLVYGGGGLKEFVADLSQVGKFYEPQWSKTQRRTTGAGRQEEVAKKIGSLRAHPFCRGENNPLGRLVELIDKKLLVHSLGKPITLPRLSPSTLQVGGGGAAATPSAPPGYKAVARSTRVETSDVDIFELPPGSRVKSDTMLAELSAILTDKESFELPSSALNSSAASSPFAARARPQFAHRQSLDVPGDGKHTASGPSLRDYRFVFDDSWKYAADADFPVRKIDWGAEMKPSITISDLCSRCNDLRLWAPTCSFSDTLDGLTEKSLVCALCRLLLQQMKGRISQRDETVYFFRAMSYITLGGERGQPIVSLCTFPGAPSLAHHEIHTSLPKLPKAGSSTHMQILSRWISGCDNSHQCFPQDIGFVPTRLLDVGSEVSPSIRLIEKQPGDSGSRRYIALSHRWGSPELHRTFITTTTSVTQFKEGIHEAELPQTFQDAVQVTRRLGVPYLWIDSLCIIQDDLQDWEAESKRMEQVFSSAYVTISASCSSGTNDGFLKPRPDRPYVTAKARDDGGALYYLRDAIDDFHLDVEEGDLSKRAWVLQERALSRRTIYFSGRQTYWECGQGVRCETLTKTKNQRASFLGDADFPHSADSFVKGMKIELYQGLYERFSNLQISFPADRPVAIKGLETRLMRAFGTTGGFGVFDIYLHRCLLWQRSDEPLKRITEFHGLPVPSWSWMAYTGGIRYLKVPYGGVSWESDVVSPFSDGVDTSGSGEHDAEAKVPGIKAVAWDLASDMAALTARGEGEAGRVILDEPGPEGTRVSHPDAAVKCVVVGRSKQRSEAEEQRLEDEEQRVEDGEQQLEDEKRRLQAGEQLQYVLIIATVTPPDGSTKVWERIGVGVLTRADISLEGPATDVLIQ